LVLWPSLLSLTRKQRKRWLFSCKGIENPGGYESEHSKGVAGPRGKKHQPHQNLRSKDRGMKLTKIIISARDIQKRAQVQGFRIKGETDG